MTPMQTKQIDPLPSKIRRLRALIWKESLQILKDPSSILIALCIPALLLFLYGFGVSLDIRNLRIGLVLEDTTPLAQSFAQSLTDSPYFEVTVARAKPPLVKLLMEGSLRGIVTVPSYFSQFLQRQGTVAPIQIISDGSETNTSNFVQNYVQGAFQNWITQEMLIGNLQKKPQIDLQSRYWYNEQLESRYSLLSGSVAIIMTLIGSLLTAMVVAREWERGTMEALMSTPVAKSELILGKVIPYFVLGMLSMALCVLISILGFHLPLRGSWLILGSVSAIFLISSLGLGLMASTLSKNQILAYQITLLSAFLPAYMLSGFLFEISSMPVWIRTMSHLVPARYFVQSLQTLFLVGDVPRIILKDILPMLGIASIFFFITIRKTVKRLDA